MQVPVLLQGTTIKLCITIQGPTKIVVDTANISSTLITVYVTVRPNQTVQVSFKKIKSETVHVVCKSNFTARP